MEDFSASEFLQQPLDSAVYVSHRLEIYQYINFLHFGCVKETFYFEDSMRL